MRQLSFQDEDLLEEQSATIDRLSAGSSAWTCVSELASFRLSNLKTYPTVHPLLSFSYFNTPHAPQKIVVPKSLVPRSEARNPSPIGSVHPKVDP